MSQLVKFGVCRMDHLPISLCRPVVPNRDPTARLGGARPPPNYQMEQRTLKNVIYCLNTNICSYLEISGGQSYHLYLNVVDYFNTSLNQTSVAA
jgi:hypothetical protein